MSDSTNTSFDLSSMLQRVFNSWKFIFIVLLVGLLAGVAFFFIFPPKYEHKSVALLRNPLENDRNHIFSQGNLQNKLYFATEENIDEVMAISKTTDLYWNIIGQLDLNSKLGTKAEGILRKNLKIKRNDNKEIQFTYTSTDKELGAQIVNTALELMEETYSGYFSENNKKIADQLAFQSEELLSRISALTDSILKIKNDYGLNGYLIPVRGTEPAGAVTGGNIDAGKAKGLEILQNYTSEKDRLLEDYSRTRSLISEHSISSIETLQPRHLHVIQSGHPDKFDLTPDPLIYFLAVGVSSLFLGIIISLFRRK